MKKRFIILVVIFICINKLSAQESILYDDAGKLRIDTTYTIDTAFLKDFQKFETQLLCDLFTRIEYPAIGWENNLQGTLILKISKDEKFAVEVAQSIDPAIDSYVESIVNERRNVILFFLNKYKKFNFYIPFKFEIDDEFYKNLQKNKSITIQKKLNNQDYTRLSIVK